MYKATKKTRPISAALAMLAALVCSYPLVSCSATGAAGRGSVVAEGLDARFKAAAEELKNTGSLDGLEQLRALSPGTPWGARAAYLLGLNKLNKLKTSGRPANTGQEPDIQTWAALSPQTDSASSLFARAMALESIRDHAEYHRAMALLAELEFEAASAAFAAFLTNQPDSILLAKAKYHLAESIEGTGALERARVAYDDFVSAYPKDALVPDALLRSAVLSAAVSDPAAAAKTAARILVKYPAGDAARSAEKLIEDNQLVADLVRYTVEEKLERAENLLSAARYKDAAAQFLALRDSGDAQTARAAAMRLAAVYMRARLYGDAEAVLTALIKSGVDRDREPEALYTLAAAYMRQGKFEKLIEAEKAIAKKHPKSKERGQVMLLLGRAYEEKSDFDSAAAIYSNAAELVAGPQFVEEAAWRGAWLAYRQGRFESAYKTLSEFSGAKEQAKFAYWSGRSAEKTGRLDAATAHYASVVRIAAAKGSLPETAESAYYAKLALELLPTAEKNNRAQAATVESLAPAEIHGAQAALKPSDVFIKDRHYAAAMELDQLGLGAAAAAELALLSERYAGDRAALLELSAMFYRSGNLNLGLRSYRRFAGSNGETGVFSYDPGLLAYPPQAVNLVKTCIASQKVDPRLVAAVMREESAFNPTIISRAGALGLMQIMPATGRQIAASIKDSGYDDKALLNPEKSIRYGSWYIEKLLSRFNNNIVFAIAAYNAGPAAVAGWLKNLPAATDEFIESIPYGETRNYTKKVLTSYSGFLSQTGDAPISIITLGTNVKTASSAVAEEAVDF